MNLLNKKIKDKIKLLDDIDKQYNPHVQSQPKKNYIPMQNKNQNENVNSVELIKNSTNENFDQVYSNFMLIFAERNIGYYDSAYKRRTYEADGRHEGFR